MFRKEKKKGVEDLIEIENPNRVVKKNIKAKDADVNATVELSRRERYVIQNPLCVQCMYVHTYLPQGRNRTSTKRISLP